MDYVVWRLKNIFEKKSEIYSDQKTFNGYMAEEAQSFLGAGKRKDGGKNIMNDKKVQVLKREGE